MKKVMVVDKLSFTIQCEVKSQLTGVRLSRRPTVGDCASTLGIGERVSCGALAAAAATSGSAVAS